MMCHRIAETLPSSTDLGSRKYKAALAYTESQYVAQTFSVIKNSIDDPLK